MFIGDSHSRALSVHCQVEGYPSSSPHQDVPGTTLKQTAPRGEGTANNMLAQEQLEGTPGKDTVLQGLSLEEALPR